MTIGDVSCQTFCTKRPKVLAMITSVPFCRQVKGTATYIDIRKRPKWKSTYGVENVIELVIITFVR